MNTQEEFEKLLEEWNYNGAENTEAAARRDIRIAFALGQRDGADRCVQAVEAAGCLNERHDPAHRKDYDEDCPCSIGQLKEDAARSVLSDLSKDNK